MNNVADVIMTGEAIDNNFGYSVSRSSQIFPVKMKNG